MATKLTKHNDQQKKIAELSEAVRLKAVELQQVSEQAQAARAEAQAQAERKSRLVQECSDLELEVKSAKEWLSAFKTKAEQATSGLKQEVSALEAKRAELTQTVAALVSDIQDLQGILTDAEKYKVAIAEGRKELMALQIEIANLHQEGAQADATIQEKLHVMEAKETEIDQITAYQKENWAKILDYANRVEHNTKVLNMLYKRGDIKIVVPDLVLPEWHAF